MNKRITIFMILIAVGTFVTACSSNPEQDEDTPTVEVESTIAVENPTEPPLVVEEPTELPEPTIAVEEPTNPPTEEATSMPDLTVPPLPERTGPRTQTSGTVPHVQLNVEPITAVNDELTRLSFTLPGVEERPTIVSLPGARGMWLTEGVPVLQPDAIVNGREFAHIHPDGSLHAPLPLARALEVEATGWGERHPWADQRPGWEGFVMLYTPLSMEELDVTFQLIVESYNFVTGETLQAETLNPAAAE